VAETVEPDWAMLEKPPKGADHVAELAFPVNVPETDIDPLEHTD
jgi:hypothetical protein